MTPSRGLSRGALLACALLGAAPAGVLHAQIESVTRLTAAPARYERVDFVVMLTADWHDPYRSADVRFDLDLVAPSGKSLRVPGYYERGASGRSSVWRLRFAPQETGHYQGAFELVAGPTHARSALVTFEVAPSAAKGFLHPAGAWGFRFDDGTFFRGLGENIGWEARTFDDSRHLDALNENPRYNYEYLLGSLHAAGGNFFRTWMCPWNLPLEWKHPVNNNGRYTDDPAHFNASAMRRMDDLVDLATATDTYFMLAIEAHGALLGSGWDASSYNAKNGGPARTPAEFFTNPEARAQFKDRLRYLVARWGYSPHVAVWEFFNEVDNAMYGQQPRIPDDVVTAWHAEMSAYLKTLDCYGHVVTTSISHREVAGLDDIATIDLNQRHIYGDTDSIPATIRRRLQEHGKPYAIGEFSFEWDWTKNFADFAPQMDHDFKHGLWLGLFSPTPILPMSWWWEYFDHRGMTAYLSRVRKLDEQMLAAGHGDFREIGVTWSGPALRHVIGVACGPTVFVLLSNAAGSAAAGSVQLPAASSRHYSLQSYDPEADRFSTVAPSAGPEAGLPPVTVPANSDSILILRAD